MIAIKPAASALCIESLSITPNCNQIALAPIAIARSTLLPTSSELMKKSTTSTLTGISSRVAYPFSP